MSPYLVAGGGAGDAAGGDGHRPDHGGRGGGHGPDHGGAVVLWGGEGGGQQREEGEEELGGGGEGGRRRLRVRCGQEGWANWRSVYTFMVIVLCKALQIFIRGNPPWK